MKKVLILGVDSLIGSNLIEAFSKRNFQIYGTSRRKLPIVNDGISLYNFSIGDSLEEFFSKVTPDVVINCIVDKTKKFRSINSIKDIFLINSIFPRQLQRFCSNHKSFLIQLGTDAVFGGMKTFYNENDRRFPRTLYGWTKKYGEVNDSNSLLLRFSMVATGSLGEKSQNHIAKQILTANYGATLVASTIQNWNGVTVSNVSDLILHLCESERRPVGTRHFFSSSKISRFELLTSLSKHFNRNDLRIVPADEPAKRGALSTHYREDLKSFWNQIGYSQVPHFFDLL